MLRRGRWTVLGILGLSVLMCGGCSAEAQSEAAGTRQAAGARQQAGGQALSGGEAADLRDSVAELRAEVSQLRREVTRLRAQVAEGSGTGDARADDTGRGGSGGAQGTGGAGTAGAARDVSGTGAGARTGPGTGGSGTASAAQGAGDTGAAQGGGSAGVSQGTGGAGTSGTGGTGTAQGTGGAGTGGTGTEGAGTGGAGGTGAQAPVASDVPPAGSTVPAPRGTQVVNAVYTGEVRSASERQVVIAMDGGGPLVLGVDPATRVYREGRSIGVGQLKKGEQVRAVVDLVGQDKTLEIAVLPAATPEG